jgi:hypothetical protein
LKAGCEPLAKVSSAFECLIVVSCDINWAGG